MDEQKKLIEEMLSDVEEDLRQKGRENHFIDSLRRQFDANGSLSAGQIEALRKWYERL